MNGNGTQDTVSQPTASYIPPIENTTREVEFAITWVNHGIKVLNARLLGVLSLLGALCVFGFTLYDPTVLRIWAAALYSVGVLWPIIALYLRKG